MLSPLSPEAFAYLALVCASSSWPERNPLMTMLYLSRLGALGARVM